MTSPWLASFRLRSVGKTVACVREMSGIRVGVGKTREVPESKHMDYILKHVWYGMKNGTKLEGEMVRANSISTASIKLEALEKARR
jgi:hypothetical protein